MSSTSRMPFAMPTTPLPPFPSSTSSSFSFTTVGSACVMWFAFSKYQTMQTDIGSFTVVVIDLLDFFLLSSFYFTCSPTYNFAIYGVKCHKSCVRFRFFVLMLCFFPVYICSNCQQFTFYLSAFAVAASVVVGSFLPSSCCLFYLYCILVYAAGGGGCCALKF